MAGLVTLVGLLDVGVFLIGDFIAVFLLGSTVLADAALEEQGLESVYIQESKYKIA